MKPVGILAAHDASSLGILRVLMSARGARLMHGRHVVSIALKRPGASHSLFDVMAACAVALARGPRLALLGFGCGAIVAPLRAMGFPHKVDAVDLAAGGAALLRRVASEWIEPLHFQRAEASAWLTRQRPFDIIVVDLSVPAGGDLVMPDVCFTMLRDLIPRRLTRHGVAVVNSFSPGPSGWRALIARLRPRGFDLRIVEPREFDHRILILGRRLDSARALGQLIRARLSAIRSNQHGRIRLRTPA